MGDKYTLSGLFCAYCGVKQENCYYAESSGSRHFTCSRCKRVNWISMSFTTRIVSKKDLEKLYNDNGFGELSEKDLEEFNKEYPVGLPIDAKSPPNDED